MCGKPWTRVVEKTGGPPNNRFRDGLAGNCKTAHTTGTVAGAALSRLYKEYGYPKIETIGWRPTCECGIEETVPAICLDPFMGSGTVGLVAKKLNRDFLGIELNPEYAEMARRRIGKAMSLFMEA